MAKSDLTVAARVAHKLTGKFYVGMRVQPIGRWVRDRSAPPPVGTIVELARTHEDGRSVWRIEPVLPMSEETGGHRHEDFLKPADD